jgi:hypothetical protein
VNIFIHVLNGILVYLITNRLVKPNYLSLLVALLFISHPLQTNVVTYIVQRNGELATFFYLLSFLFFIEGNRKESKLKIPFYSGCIIAYICALWSKEIGITAPIIFLIYHYYFISGNKSISIKKAIVYSVPLILIIVFALYTVDILCHLKNWMNPHDSAHWSIGQNLLSQANVIIEYMKLLILPSPDRLNVDHEFQLAKSLFEYPTFLSVTVIFSLSGLAIYLRRKARVLSFAVLWFFVTLIPSSSLIPTTEIMVEYRLYLPSFGFCLFMVVIIHQAFTFLGKRKGYRMSQ